MKRGIRPPECRDCGRPLVSRYHKNPPPGHVAHKGHGFCSSDYDRRAKQGHNFNGPLMRHGRRNRDVIEDWAILSGRGMTRREAAQVIGMTKSALDKAIERWKQRSGIPAIPRSERYMYGHR